MTTIISVIKTFAFAALVSGIMYGCVMAVSMQSQARTEYALEHNCRWDYNDMCYTEDERPWLFK